MAARDLPRHPPVVPCIVGSTEPRHAVQEGGTGPSVPSPPNVPSLNETCAGLGRLSGCWGQPGLRCERVKPSLQPEAVRGSGTAQNSVSLEGDTVF